MRDFLFNVQVTQYQQTVEQLSGQLELLKDNNEKYKDEVTWRNLYCKHGRIYWGGGVGRVKPPA